MRQALKITLPSTVRVKTLCYCLRLVKLRVYTEIELLQPKYA